MPVRSCNAYAAPMAGLGDIFSQLGKQAGFDASGLGRLDPRKLVDLVDTLWDSRGKIVEAVNFLSDNRDAITSAIGFVQEHADELLDLAKKLPDLLGSAGAALDTAGEGAIQASQMLLGDGGVSVAGLADDAGAALEAAQAELAAVMALFDQAGASLARVPLVGDVVQPFIDGAARIGAVADQLGSVGTQVRGLGGVITSAGGDLGGVGAALSSSGVALQRLTSPGAVPRSFTAPAPRPATRKPKQAPSKSSATAASKKSPKASTRKPVTKPGTKATKPKKKSTR